MIEPQYPRIAAGRFDKYLSFLSILIVIGCGIVIGLKGSRAAFYKNDSHFQKEVLAFKISVRRRRCLGKTLEKGALYIPGC